MIELKKADRAVDQRIRTLYREAFPAEERAPYWFLKLRAWQKRADFWSLTDADNWVGMAYVLRHEDLAYLFYLAIDSERRGRGYGTQAMAAFQKRYHGCRLFLGLETLDENAKNYAQRVMRHAFYLRCGLVDLPYWLKEAGVVFAIMGTGGKVEPEEYKAMIDEWMGLRKLRIDTRMLKER